MAKRRRRIARTIATRPVSVYGCSKLLGEWFARDAPRWYVLRVESLFGGRQARSSVDKIAAALARRPTDARVRRSGRHAELCR